MRAFVVEVVAAFPLLMSALVPSMANPGWPVSSNPAHHTTAGLRPARRAKAGAHGARPVTPVRMLCAATPARQAAGTRRAVGLSGGWRQSPGDHEQVWRG